LHLARALVQGEYEYEIDEVEGTVPASLIGGVLYRNGPALFERGRA